MWLVFVEYQRRIVFISMIKDDEPLTIDRLMCSRLRENLRVFCVCISLLDSFMPHVEKMRQRAYAYLSLAIRELLY